MDYNHPVIVLACHKKHYSSAGYLCWATCTTENHFKLRFWIQKQHLIRKY